MDKTNIPADVKQPRVETWLSFSVVSIGLIVAMLAGGRVWQSNWWVQAISLTIVSLGCIGYLIWRGIIQHTRFPNTGLELEIGVAIVTILLAWISTSNQRAGLERVSLLLGCFLLFYILVDAFQTGLSHHAVTAAMLVFSGLLCMLAVLETYLAYSVWFKAVGWGTWPPYPYRFAGMLGHPNSLMAVLNLCAPMALMGFFTWRNRIARFASALWLGFFLAALPFSSSRGGYLGFAGSVGVLFMFWLFFRQPYKRWWNWFQKHRIISILIAMVLVIVVTGSGLMVYKFLAGHPSHGSGIFGSRTPIWQTAISIWESSPLFGSGLGRFGLAYLQASESVPPDYWATHAHNTFLQALAESGIAGLGALLLLVVSTIIIFIRKWRNSSTKTKVWDIALFAGIVSLVVQSLVDDFSSWGAVLVPVALTTARLASGEKGKVERWAQVSFNILWIPTILLIFGGVFRLWAYQPLALGMHYARQGDLKTAALEAGISTSRDPRMPYYPIQTGLAWASVWGEEQDALGLMQARVYLTMGIGLEKSPSWLWADLGVLDAYAAEPEQAFIHLDQAVSRASREPSYPLNIGWIAERNGMQEKAHEAYLRALDLAPQWRNHPFWHTTPLRLSVLSEWQTIHPVVDTSTNGQAYWEQAKEAIAVGNYAESIRNIAFAQWSGEPSLAIVLVQAEFAESQGDMEAALFHYEKMVDILSAPYLENGNHPGVIYSRWLYEKDGIDFDTVPGYIHLQADYGQFQALAHFWSIYQGMGRCDDANRIWNAWQRAIQGGALDDLPPAPTCPE